MKFCKVCQALKIYCDSNMIISSWNIMSMTTTLLRKTNWTPQECKKNYRFEKIDHENLKKVFNTLLWKKGYYLNRMVIKCFLHYETNEYILQQSYWENFLGLRTKPWKCRISHWKFLLNNKLLWQSEFLRDLEQT